MNIILRRSLQNVGMGLTAGILAAPALGLGEWLAITRTVAQPDSASLTFGIIAYAGVAALFGAGLGFLGGIISSRRNRASTSISFWSSIARYWVLTLSIVGIVVARFRIIRDVFDEQLALFSPQGLLVHAGLLITAATLIALVWWLTQPQRRTQYGAATRSVPDPSRRQFLKTALTVGLIATPPVAAATRMLKPSASTLTVPSVVRSSSVLSGALRDRPNVIYLMIDTLRADHLSSYGYPKKISPRIDALAAEGIRFSHHFAQASWTKPCVACQLTSMYPASHQALHKTDRLPDAVTTLPEALARHGYATAGFAANVNVAPLFNFSQGFHSYEFLSPTALFNAPQSASQLAVYQGMRQVYERVLSTNKSVRSFYYPAEDINRRATEWMSLHGDQSFFMFLHYMDPHDPYFEHPYDGYGIARVSTPNPSAEMAEELKRLYVGEIEYLDRQLGELFDWLKQQGLYDNTMIVLTSDHGEEFQEHGGWWHGLTLYEEQIHVPLITKLPNGARAGEVDSGISQSIDIMPTILGTLGLPRPVELQGIDLFSADERLGITYAEQSLEGNVLRSVRGTNWKFIEANEGNPRGLPTQQFFNIGDDPYELNDVAASERDGVAQLLADANRIQDWAMQRAVATQQTDIDAATLEQLQNIGY